MKERYRNMMMQIELSEEARTAIENGLSSREEKSTRTRKLPLRLMIAAACICAAMATGVAFAGAGDSVVEQENILSTQEESSYEMSAYLRNRDTADLGSQLRKQLSAGNIGGAFYSREEIEEYLGFSLISAPELEAAGINEGLATDFEYGFDIRPELAVAPDARYVITGENLDGSAAEGVPDVVKVSGHRIMRNAEVYIEARILVNQNEDMEYAYVLTGEQYEPTLLPHHEIIFNPDDYTDYEVITTDYYSAEKKFTSYQHNMENGDVATIVHVINVEMDGTNGFTDYHGYFIHDGILYSVYPYAIYDPHLSFPMHDYDMLTVLREVLDSFGK